MLPSLISSCRRSSVALFFTLFAPLLYFFPGIVYTNLQQFIDDLFLIHELNGFLKNEKESFDCNINTYLDKEEYKKLTKSINLVDDFTGIYYNSDYGTSYDDITRILRDIIYDLEVV